MVLISTTINLRQEGNNKRANFVHHPRRYSKKDCKLQAEGLYQTIYLKFLSIINIELDRTLSNI